MIVMWGSIGYALNVVCGLLSIPVITKKAYDNTLTWQCGTMGPVSGGNLFLKEQYQESLGRWYIQVKCLKKWTRQGYVVRKESKDTLNVNVNLLQELLWQALNERIR